MGQDGMLALAKLQLCFQADPRNLDTLALLARAFGAIGQANKGIEVQKEMARLAKEQGQLELFRELVDKLLRVAPNDEQVRALSKASGMMKAVSVPPASVAAPIIREATREASSARRVDEPSYSSVDSQDFVDEAEVMDADDSIAGRRSERAPESAPRYDTHGETARFSSSPEILEPDVVQGGATSVGRRPQLPSEPLLEIDEEAIEIDEAETTDDDAEIREAVAQSLADAASFRRVRLFAKALESLQTGLELDPMSRDVHEAMRDILVETGDYAAAAGHVVVIAGMQLEAGDMEAAVHGLYDALSLQPALRSAEEMLQSLGYELPVYAETHGEAPQADGHALTVGPPADAPEYARAADDDRLPAYDMQETDDLPPGPPAPATGPNLDDFGSADAPLPSFPMAGESEPAFDLVQPKTSRPPPYDDTGPVDAARTAELEEVLEEADFFASRGLFDDARVILTEQLAIHPRHVLLNERLTELDAQEKAAVEASGTRSTAASTSPRPSTPSRTWTRPARWPGRRSRRPAGRSTSRRSSPRSRRGSPSRCRRTTASRTTTSASPTRRWGCSTTRFASSRSRRGTRSAPACAARWSG
jgi:tetratricopeptide (TPR) repeat protein